MVLRCSLLGHDYGEPEVDREREERGSEVVLTVQTYEECARCGDRHIISENTEITSLTPDERRREVDRVGETTTRSEDPDGDESEARRGPDPASAGANGADPQEDDGDWPRTGGRAAGSRTDDPVRGPGGDDATGPDRASASQTRDDAAGADTDGGTRSDGPGDAPEPTPGGSEPAETTTGRNVPTDEAGEPIEDGEVLEDDGRKPGEWPDPDDVGPPADEDGRERWADLDIDRVGGEELTYEEPERVEGTSNEPTEDAGSGSAVTDPGTGIASATSAPAPGENPTVEPADTEFYCPTCAFVAPGDHGSLRPGDICPDCGRGYIGERNRE
ncbi:hypothetical protein [Saliphagus sp. LR7]|uniref:DUF7093 family protein n=1 Tax=Saliphagus sp. LR7 TaxID=2282654 RepID=UPI000DF7F1D3|nr:hypothetical protein [Saliphagus sp. LR7]